MKLIKVEKSERSILENLLQLYLHDLSLYYPSPFNPKTGLYEYNIDEYFTNPHYKAYFILNEDGIAGFALIIIDEEFIRPTEIFVLNQYKGKGLATFALNRLFEEYSGNWEIKIVPNSKKAEKLWTRLVKEYTNGNYQTERVGTYNRLVINFNNK